MNIVSFGIVNNFLKRYRKKYAKRIYSERQRLYDHRVLPTERKSSDMQAAMLNPASPLSRSAVYPENLGGF